MRQFRTLLISVALGWTQASGCCTDEDGDGWCEEEGDCNDSDADIHPGAEDTCDGVDRDCDGVAGLSSSSCHYAGPWVQPAVVIVDDYESTCNCNDKRQWYYSTIGTDRGVMGSTDPAPVTFESGVVRVSNSSGWAGVWTSLMHRAVDRDQAGDHLDPHRLLGPYVLDTYQSQLKGVEIALLDGQGQLKVELKGAEGLLFAESRTLSGGGEVLRFDVTLPAGITVKELSWLLDGAGHAVVDEVRLLISGPSSPIPEAVFLYSLSHLSQCYDAASGMMADRTHWPVESFAANQAIGMFALSAAVGWRLGYIDRETAVSIVSGTEDAFSQLPTCHGILPHFSERNDSTWTIEDNTEWSTIDTVLSLTSAILAAQALELPTQPLEDRLRQIDWEELLPSEAGALGPISMGYAYDPDAPDHCGEKLAASWDRAGSEQFIMAVAYAAAHEGATPSCAEQCGTQDEPATWDGSGFNDELAALFYPMDRPDDCTLDWPGARCLAAKEQLETFDSYAPYQSQGLFGLSAAEVPRPCAVPEAEVYGAWGTGGCAGFEDGSDVPLCSAEGAPPATLGYPILAPHYAAMIFREHPAAATELFEFLLVEADSRGIFTPLNNVESFGIDAEGALHWNSLKGSWNLSMQALGAARALSCETEYLPYTALRANEFLSTGYDAVMQSGL